MSATATDLRAWLDAGRRALDAALERFVPAAGPVPALVSESMRYSLFAGGKRLRPMLSLAGAEAVAERLGHDVAQARQLALPAACALEMIHTYSLVHDDLPAMDNDSLRRGRPTSHVVFGEGIAILAGDALLTEAFALLAREPQAITGMTDAELNRRKVQTLQVIAEAAGAAGMVGGQAIDLRAAAPGAAPLDVDALRDMHGRKTGALIRASALSGALMAGATEPMADAVGRYATLVGLALQIVDDILDVEGASADLGKTAGKDAASGKPTYPALYGLDESRRLAAQCVTGALDALSAAGISGHLPAIALWVTGRTN